MVSSCVCIQAFAWRLQQVLQCHDSLRGVQKEKKVRTVYKDQMVLDDPVF